MKQKLYVVYDLKAECPLGVIQWFSNDAAAVRMFESICRAPNTMLAEHPEDFVLLCLGVIDLTTLSIELNVANRMVPIAEGFMIARAFARARERDVGENGADGDPRQIDFTRGAPSVR